eukprot:CCRYP_010103-RA/>CCRYP_010103-RA protein AED:0.00 eAED:0.00 QI:92/1/0.5/1/0/0/2/0/89
MNATVKVIKNKFKNTIVLLGLNLNDTNIATQNTTEDTNAAMRFPLMVTKKPPQNAPPQYPAGIMSHLHPPFNAPQYPPPSRKSANTPWR